MPNMIVREAAVTRKVAKARSIPVAAGLALTARSAEPGSHPFNDAGGRMSAWAGGT